MSSRDDEKQLPTPESATEEKPKKPRASRKTAGSARKPARPRKPRSLALPVLITDETVLLPHMSIPFPIEDDETAFAIDRAMRMNPRQILVLTERRVLVDGASEPNEADRDLIDMVTDLIAAQNGEVFGDDAATPSTDAGDGEETWTDTASEPNVQYELCEVGVVAEIGQYISRPGGQDHVILQGISRGIVEDFIQDQPYVAARVRRVEDVPGDPSETEAAMSAVLEQIESYISRKC
jgi:ATP-dependent Lon protease